MKKWVFLLFALPLFAFAKNTDSDGREWVTAQDLTAQTNEVSEDLAKTLKNYVILDNDIHKCYFPEIFEQPEKANDLLDQWADEAPAAFSLYTRIFYRLPYARLPEEIQNKMDNTNLRDEVNVPPLSDFYKQLGKTTTIKTDKDCEKLSKFIFEDLLPNY